MEIGTLHARERERLLELLDGWALPDGWAGRDFFRRFLELDPTYDDENVFVAREGGALLSCVQIFPRHIQLLGHAVPTGGIGSVFTREDRRSGGLAGALLEAAAGAMRERGMCLSLLFSGRLSFYEQHGYASWKSERARVRRSEEPRRTTRARGPGGECAESGNACEIVSFEGRRDQPGVEAIHAEYSAARNGPVVRDAALWRASFALAGNPDERFVVARRAGEVAAYLRVTQLYARAVVTELGRRDDAPEALAMLVDAALAKETEGTRPADRPDELLLPAFDDLQFTLALEQLGISSRPIDDPTNMLRCLDGQALARHIGVPMRRGESDLEFLRRILPADSFVFWPADRF